MCSPVSREVLQDWLTYEPDTGLFRWLRSPCNRTPAGSVAGHTDRRGYIEIQVEGQREYAHRLAVLYMTGSLPADEVDHRNGSKSDNRWNNLREVTRTVNQQNLRRAQTNSSTGLLGVMRSGEGRFCARIVVNGERLNLGSFKTPEEAHAAYVSAKRQFHEGNTL